MCSYCQNHLFLCTVRVTVRDRCEKRTATESVICFLDFHCADLVMKLCSFEHIKTLMCVILVCIKKNIFLCKLFLAEPSRPNTFLLECFEFWNPSLNSISASCLIFFFIPGHYNSTITEVLFSSPYSMLCMLNPVLELKQLFLKQSLPFFLFFSLFMFLRKNQLKLQLEFDL